MPFALDGQPTLSEIAEAVNYLLGNFSINVTADPNTGQVTGPDGTVVSYLYKYLAVKYADSFDGSVNFSNTQTNRQYYGLRNSNSSVESTNPADYLWTKVTGGFGTTKSFYYAVTGGRQISYVVSTSAPSSLYVFDNGSSIDLDVISGSDGSSARICYAKTTASSLSSIPATYQTTGNNSFPPPNTWGGSETWQATPPSLAANEYLFQSDGIYNPVTNLTTWNSPYLSSLKVGQLSAISADLGTITAGSLTAVDITGSDLTIGSSPAISGTTMTGSGAHIYDTGNFAFGNSTTNMVFNGSALYLNGFVDYSSSTASTYTLLSGSTYYYIPLIDFTVPTTLTVNVSANTSLYIARTYASTNFVTSSLLYAFYQVIPATQTVAGRLYVIRTLGTTNFTSIGAASNTVNLLFSATGVGTGTGTVYDISTGQYNLSREIATSFSSGFGYLSMPVNYGGNKQFTAGNYGLVLNCGFTSMYNSSGSFLGYCTDVRANYNDTSILIPKI